MGSKRNDDPTRMGRPLAGADDLLIEPQDSAGSEFPTEETAPDRTQDRSPRNRAGLKEYA